MSDQKPDPVVVRELLRTDYARAGRAALAQVERDAAALDQVLTEAVNDPNGSGVVRLAIALAAQSAVLSEQLHGENARAPFLHQISESIRQGGNDMG